MACAWRSESPNPFIRFLRAVSTLRERRMVATTSSRSPERDQQAFEDVRPRLRPPELVARPARHHLELVGDVVPQGLPVGERPRHAVDERNQVHPETLLHLGVLVEVVEDDLGYGLALQFDHDAHAVAVRLVAQIGDVLQLAVLDQLGDLLEQIALVDLVRDLRDHYLGPVRP